jgi:hypothetical protein
MIHTYSSISFATSLPFRGREQSAVERVDHDTDGIDMDDREPLGSGAKRSQQRRFAPTPPFLGQLMVAPMISPA